MRIRMIHVRCMVSLDSVRYYEHVRYTLFLSLLLLLLLCR
jgi:hypothetical protein